MVKMKIWVKFTINCYPFVNRRKTLKKIKPPKIPDFLIKTAIIDKIKLINHIDQQTWQ